MDCWKLESLEFLELPPVEARFMGFLMLGRPGPRSPLAPEGSPVSHRKYNSKYYSVVQKGPAELKNMTIHIQHETR